MACTRARTCARRASVRSLGARASAWHLLYLEAALPPGDGGHSRALPADQGRAVTTPIPRARIGQGHGPDTPTAGFSGGDAAKR